MTQVRTQIKQKMFSVTPFVILLLCKITVAEELQSSSDVSEIPIEMQTTTDVIDQAKYLLFSDVDDLPDDSMAKQIFIEGEEIFKGIMVSVILFMVCAGRAHHRDRVTPPYAISCDVHCHTSTTAITLRRDGRPPVFGEHDRNKKLVTMSDGSLMDMVITTLGVLITMAMLSCLCCLCMKFSDLKLKAYIVEMAKKKGIKVDMDKLEPKYQPCLSPHANENCTIMIPDVAIVL
ncbi:unnamed protein product [Chrysodeixis includens]|uniref:Uncharacterized protein n=1 Tax=Chrysodeixis includens TaxID=689277 RepID=A0A9N8KYX2_CHRIL|nr:unnamed protein product [Chrysodeixis includens]